MAEETPEQIAERRIEEAARSGATSVDLGRRGLRELPESIGRLTQLRELSWLGRNQLTTLPESMQKLIHLEELFLHGNDALGIPPEILGPTWQQVSGRKGKPANPAEILQYYFRSRAEATRALNEAKILLVGQGGVGKTSLVKRLVHNAFDPEEPKTEGINITQWPIPAQSGEADGNIRLNIWDFGGQEIMHATHQFFLTKRSLYLLGARRPRRAKTKATCTTGCASFKATGPTRRCSSSSTRTSRPTSSI